MSKLLKKPTSKIDMVPNGVYERFNLIENPFPSQAILNKDSSEKKVNGSIYEPDIRTSEYEKLLTNFIKNPQSDLNHQRIGFILDSSFIGRGNGKTAFMLDIYKRINEEFCLNLSNNINKCFSIYFQPEAGGKTKSFDSFIDIFFKAILDTNIIKDTLAIIRLEAILRISDNKEFLNNLGDDKSIIELMNDDNWFKEDLQKICNISKTQVTKEIFNNPYLKETAESFPLKREVKLFLIPITTQNDFEKYYLTLKKGKERIDFIFTDLIYFFLSAGFNGAYIFIDDFERIPDHQSAIQKKDFVTQLRSVTYDGLYLNSKIGFYNMIFALHAGVPRILQEAWGLAGLEQRVSLNPTFENPKHIILFEKINDSHVVLLMRKYLSEYRINNDYNIELFPFTEDAVKLIGLKSEFNAAKTLQMAYNILDHASSEEQNEINRDYILEKVKQSGMLIEKEVQDSISKTDSIDLIDKSQNPD